MKYIFIVIGSVLLFFLAANFYASFYDLTPKPKTFFDRHGKYVGTISPKEDGFQIWTTLDKIPDKIINKTLNQEDRFFYYHLGINPIAIIKAALANITHRSIIRGGSTITQQLAKNLIQESEHKPFKRNIFNKVKEALLSIGLELRHNKNWILERYINLIYYGKQCYGIKAASQFYFQKDLNELNEKEIAFLVSLPIAPTRNQKNRSSISVKTEPNPQVYFQNKTAKHFMEMLSEKSDENNLFFTTLDLSLQQDLEDALSVRMNSVIQNDPLINVAAIVIDVPTGDVLALIGSRNYTDKNIQGFYNAALALRQPGSTLKPFTYFTAFSKGYTADTILEDSPISFQANPKSLSPAYIPQNFDKRYHGNVNIREALANSYNVPAVITLNDIGLSTFHDILKKFGFHSFNKPPSYYGLAYTLGSGETSLLELTNAYAALARGGYFLPTRFLTHSKIDEAIPVISNSKIYANQITSILSDPQARLKTFGFSETLNIDDYLIAVKTGTSYNHRDNWAIGYNQDKVIGVWVGHNDDSPLLGTTGATGAGPIWHAFAERVFRGTKSNSSNLESSKNKKNVSLNDSQKFSSIGLDLSPIKVLSPLNSSHYRVNREIPFEHQKILARIEVKDSNHKTIHWYLDHQLIETSNAHLGDVLSVEITPQIGNHQLELISENEFRKTIFFSVNEIETIDQD